MHYKTGRKRTASQNALTQMRSLPKIRTAYLDRLRERPLEAGATIQRLTGTKPVGRGNGANSCEFEPSLEFGRWAANCAVYCCRNGYER